MKPKRRTLIILAAIGIGVIAVAASYVVLLKPSMPSSPEIYRWSIRTVDAGVVGGLERETTSISTDSHDKVHICYYDGNRQDLKYATNSSGVWVNYTLDSLGDVGEYN